jgi:mannosyltransferase
VTSLQTTVSSVNDQDQTAMLPAQRDAVDDAGPATAVGSGSDRDQTALLPKQRYSTAGPAPKLSAWESVPPRGIAPVDGAPYGRERALGTLAWVFTAVITACLALIRLNWASMRAQELAAWRFAGTPWRLVPKLVRDLDPGAAPYDFLLHVWASVFGRSDFALRVPSVILMAAATAMISILGTRLIGPRVGVLAGLLMATLPITTRYAQEAGPAALTLFSGALATLALVAVLDRPRFWRFVGYGACVGLLGLSHISGLLIVLAHGLVVVAMRPRALPGWLPAALLGAAPTIVLVFLAAQPWGGSDDAGVRTPSVSQLGEETFGTVITGGAVLGLAMLALSLRKPAILYSAWAILPFLLLLPVAHFTTLASEQVAIVTLPAWAGLGGLGLSRVPVIRGFVVVLVLAAIGIPGQVAIRQSDGHGQASHRVADVIYAEALPGDGIMYGPANGDGPTGRAMIDRYLSAARRPKDLLAQPGSGASTHLLRVPECPNVDACVGQTPRIWLVRVGSVDSPLTGLEAGKDGALRVRYDVKQTWRLTGLTLTLFTLKQRAS